MILRVVLSGILTFVAEGGWKNPRAVHVLLNKGAGSGQGGHATVPHHPILFFSSDHVAKKHPKAAFLFADRDCGKEPRIAFQPPREAWVFSGHELTLPPGGESAFTPGIALEALFCDQFSDRSSSIPLAKCNAAQPVGSKWKVQNDIRWLLDSNELHGADLPLDPGCLKTPVEPDCDGHLAARLRFEAGHFSTRRLSGQDEEGWLKWHLALPSEVVNEKQQVVTFAGSVEVAISYPKAHEVTLYRRELAQKEGKPVEEVTLRPRPNEDMVTISIESVPLSELVVGAPEDPWEIDPCGSPPPLPERLPHAALIYNFSTRRDTIAGAQRRIPRSPIKIEDSTLGVRDINRPRCEPPSSYALE